MKTEEENETRARQTKQPEKKTFEPINCVAVEIWNNAQAQDLAKESRAAESVGR